MSVLIREIVVLKLKELTSKVYFDITVLRAILKMVDVALTAEESAFLTNVHCVTIADLSFEAREELSQYIRAILMRGISDVPESSWRWTRGSMN